MKKVLPVLLAFWPYMILLSVLFEENAVPVFLNIYILATIVVYVCNIINAFRYKGKDTVRELAFYNMMIKIAHIPFYVFVFVLGTMFLFASAVPALIFFTPIIVLGLMFTDVVLLIVSSMYGVNVIQKTRKSGQITRKSALINLIAHFLFVLDVISAVNMYCKVRK